MVNVFSPFRNFSEKIILPFSKSESNRLLVMQELSEGKINIHNLSDSEDTLLLLNILHNYKKSKTIDAENAGTVLRFLTAMLAISKGDWLLTGSQRMLARPLAPMVEALITLGAKIKFLSKYGYPPIQILGSDIIGGKISIDASISSQFISGMLMIAPMMKNGLELLLEGDVFSKPYISMTIELMKRCGVATEISGSLIKVKQGSYQQSEITVEADWSSAGFFYELAAISNSCRFFMSGLKKESLQGDAVAVELFQKLGVNTSFEKLGITIEKTSDALKEISYDFKDCPDLFIPFALACAGTQTALIAKGLRNLAIKESDRLQSVLNGLHKLGYHAEIVMEDVFVLHNSDRQYVDKEPQIAVCDDHRIAMAFAILSAITGRINLDRMDVVGKSFPDFFKELMKLGFIVD